MSSYQVALLYRNRMEWKIDNKDPDIKFADLSNKSTNNSCKIIFEINVEI